MVDAEGQALAPLQEFKRLKRHVLLQLLARGVVATEGSSSAAELQYLVRTAQECGAVRIGEIGFNIGLSSYAFLSMCPDVHLVSFDLGEHRSVAAAKRLIDKRFPGRHTLVLGDSTQTVPNYAKSHPDVRFDMVFIDGGHDYDVAHADLDNMRALSTENTVVVMDDVTHWKPWGVGPAAVWEEAVRSGRVLQEEVYQDGRRVDVLNPPGTRAWAKGRYVL
jgi:predicted O-methyltransferase YrrM